ncbi:S8 family peptidase [Methyloglobulus sp.]|uniref:S8 family peptidase n=1 Tax=Methyloglobulus sp. TaxID=2518622 RepID=UPI0039890C36
MNTIFLRPALHGGLLWLLFLFSAATGATPTITWTPPSVTQKVATGQTITVPVKFTASKNISNALVRVVPTLAPFVATNPSSFPSIPKGQTITLTLTISAAASSPIGTFDGTIQIKSGGKTNATFAKPLPVTISVKQGDASFSTLPDPDKIITDPEGAVYPVNQLLILLNEGYSRSDADNIASSINGRIIGVIPLGNMYQLEVPADTIQELESFIDLLRTDLRVKAVTQNLELQPHSVTTDLENLRNFDPTLTRAYDKLNLDGAWKLIAASPVPLHPVTIGIVDTGIDMNHPEFKDGVTVKGASSDNGSTSCGRTVDSHGTQVAGIIGANNLSSISTLSPDSPQMNGIMSGVVRGIEDDARGSIKYELLVNPKNPSLPQEQSFERKFLGEIYDYLNESIRQGAKIINISMGNGRCDQFLPNKKCVCVPEETFNDVRLAWASIFAVTEGARDVLFVASAGNDDIEAIFNLPGGGISLRNLITVGATTLTDSRAIYPHGASNYGIGVNIAAPGSVDVYAPGIYTEPLDSDRDDYKVTANGVVISDYFSGTSASAPMVTGVAGLIKAIKPELTPKNIKDILVATGNAISTNPPIGPRLDAHAAVCHPDVLDCSKAAKLNLSFNPNPAPISASSCIGVSPSWDYKATLAESAGVGVTINSFTWDFYDAGGNFLNRQDNDATDFTDFFDDCGPGSPYIGPSSTACGNLCVHYGGDDTGGSVIMTFTGQDDNGNTVTGSGSEVLQGVPASLLRTFKIGPASFGVPRGGKEQ